jgi:hypothetical protein
MPSDGGQLLILPSRHQTATISIAASPASKAALLCFVCLCRDEEAVACNSSGAGPLAVAAAAAHGLGYEKSSTLYVQQLQAEVCVHQHQSM